MLCIFFFLCGDIANEGVNEKGILWQKRTFRLFYDSSISKASYTAKGWWWVLIVIAIHRLAFHWPYCPWVPVWSKPLRHMNICRPAGWQSIIQVIKGEGNDAISKHEVPQALVPIITAYSGNPSLDQYDGFVVGLEGTHMHISRAIASPAYLDSLCQGTSSSEELLLYRSRSFDLFDCIGRRNFARFMIALFRHLARSEQSKISGDYPERIL